MAVEFDPAWEYFTCDPDVEELLEHRISVVRSLFDFGVRCDDRRDAGSSGFQITVGNPNYARTKLARAKVKYVEPSAVPDWKQCRECETWFRPRRSTSTYCSMECRPTGRMRELPDSVLCSKCGIPFRPKESSSRYCGRRCGGSMSPVKFQTTATDDKMDQLRKLHQSGMTLVNIASVLGVSLASVKRWRKALKLPDRPFGGL